MFQTKFIEEIEKKVLFSQNLFRILCPDGIMLKNIVEPGRPQMAIRRMRFTCWIPKATNTHSEPIILIAFPLQQWLHEGASMLRSTYNACLVSFANFPNVNSCSLY